MRSEVSDAAASFLQEDLMRHLLVSALVLASACQTYDFEPVSPIAISQTTQSRNVVARNLKPNLMILVDKSGSMNNPIPGMAGSTRVTELKSAMSTFLTTSGTVARVGLAFFPKEDMATPCRPTEDISVQLPAPAANDMDVMALTANAQQVNTRIQSFGIMGGIPVTGGTPTASSLSFVGRYAGLLDDRDNRQDFVLLLTDGLPNCNPNNPLSCMSNPLPPLNLCTQNPVPNPMMTNNCTGLSCRLGWLDKDAVVTAVQQLRSKNISTIVVGFGADFATPEALDVLNSMAEQGGFGRKCPNCGANNACNMATGFCQKQFYAAANATELGQALADIQNLIGMNDPCNFSLSDSPQNNDPRYLAVIINNQTVTTGPNTWTLLPSGSVQFNGPLCDRVKASTTSEPLRVEFRIVNTL